MQKSLTPHDITCFRNCKRNEKKLREEVTKLQDHLRQAVEDCERTTDQLEKKVY
jgi:hypothetical protein